MATLVDSLYSRAGQNSKDKFQVLKQLNQVLYRRSQSQDLRPRARERKRGPSVTVLEEMLTLPVQEVNEGVAGEKGSEKSFVFAVQSRDDYYASHVKFRQTTKNSVPPCGHYNVSYAQVDRNLPALKLVEGSVLPQNDFTPWAPPPQHLPKLSKRQIRMVAFSKQSKRRPLRSQFEGPHEKRFVAWNVEPTVWSNHK